MTWNTTTVDIIIVIPILLSLIIYQILISFDTACNCILPAKAHAFQITLNRQQQRYRRSNIHTMIRPTRLALKQQQQQFMGVNNIKYLYGSALSSGNNVDQYQHEETLLCIRMSIQPSLLNNYLSNSNVSITDMKHNTTMNDAISKGSKSTNSSNSDIPIVVNDVMTYIMKFCHTFPFPTILPVQPLQYIPTIDGVDIKFLRKKTPDRDTMYDGGIRFFIYTTTTTTTTTDPFNTVTNTFNNDQQLTSSKINHMDDDDDTSTIIIELIAKRNSQGQVITKLMSEKIVITNFVSYFIGHGLSNDNSTGTTMTSSSSQTNTRLSLKVPSPTLHMVLIQSLYHKWM